MRRLFARFRRNERGNIAMLFGLSAVPLLGMTGVAVDYTRASRFDGMLQSAVDAAALAGATSLDDAKIPEMVEAYMQASLPGGLSPNHVTYTLSLTAETVTVTAKAEVSTALSTIFLNKIPVAASATASHGKPVRIVDISVTNFNSDASDANFIYWYVIPDDGSLPAQEDMNLLLSNDPANPAPELPDSIQIGVNERIGFAMVNVTGGIHPYGNNQYGQPPGSVHTFYSQNEPENLQVAGHADCASGTMQEAWDDNGGPTDDNDYNDAVFDFSCATVQMDPSTVVLIR